MEFEPVYTYTREQAIQDGVLVPLSRWTKLPFLLELPIVFSCALAESIGEASETAIALAWVGYTNREHEVYETFTRFAGGLERILIVSDPVEGITIMYPEDY